MTPRRATALAVAGILALTAYVGAPVLRCVDSCLVDYVAMYGGEVGNFALPDGRLNAWILGWVQHALLTDATLFDANAFHPARGTLSGSEHMLAVALQTLPVRLFTDSAVALHQTALVLSFGLLGLTMLFFVRWATGSVLAGFVAGACAMFMPWRYSEVSHLQLLSAQWFPVIWWLVARLLLHEGTRRDAVFLSIALALQLLSSFYLAFFALFSTTFLGVAIALQQRPRRADLARIGLALAPVLAVMLALSLPYVSRYTAYRFSSPVIIPQSTPPALVWAFLRPSLGLLADRERLASVAYYVPLVVFALGLLPLAYTVRRWPVPDVGEAGARRIRIVAVGLLAAMAGAFVLMMGRQIHLFGSDWPLPATWAAKILPGFSQMRAEFRWGIVIGLAAPALAGLGFALASVTARAPRLRLGLGAAAAVGLALNVPWFQVPAKAAWRDDTGIFEAHAALASLPPGPTVEIPWRFRRLHIANYGSRYMLASATHWNPLLNGYTAYLPPSHFFLQRIAQALPEEHALDRLQQLTGLRWIIVHPGRLLTWEVSRWQAAAEAGRLRLAFSSPTAQIYEVPESPTRGALVEQLASREPRERTLTGLSREPLEIAAVRGRLAVRAPNTMVFRHELGMVSWVDVDIENLSDFVWPSFDVDTEGLVLLRYRFLDASGSLVHEDVSALDVDAQPGTTTRTRSAVQPPASPGRYSVRFDLVQRLGDEYRPLPVAAVERDVEVAEAKEPSSRMRDALRERARHPTELTPTQ